MIKRVPVKTIPEEGVIVTTHKESRVASIEIVEDLENPSLAGLRLLAKMTYVGSPSGLSINKLSERDPFKGNVTELTLSKWSVKDGWVQEREDHKKTIEQAVLKKLGEKQVEAISEQLSRLCIVRDRLYSAISKGEAEAKSLEGVANALIKLEQFIFDARNTSANIFSGYITDKEEDNTNTSSVPVVKYPAETLRKAAIAIVKMGRKNGS